MVRVAEICSEVWTGVLEKGRWFSGRVAVVRERWRGGRRGRSVRMLMLLNVWM